MIIHDLKKEIRNGKPRISAKVKWEDCAQKDYELYFETHKEFEEDLSLNPHAFLVGCVMPAMYFGEKRVRLDEEICPELLAGLKTAMGWMQHWFGQETVKLETRLQSRLRPKKERAASFFSGGVDAFSILRNNHLSFPSGHPWRIKDGIAVFGLELDDIDAFERVLKSLKKAADEAGINLVPIYTNLYLNYRDQDDGFAFWFYWFQGAALSAVAHTLSNRISVASIASDYGIADQWPHGSDPRLDPNFGSVDLRIRHDGITLTRFQRTELIAGWDAAIRHLRVCNQFRSYGQDMFNCGRCEKCVRTMLALLSLGVLHKTDAFPKKDVTPDMLTPVNRRVYPHYVDVLPFLAKQGRNDLVNAIREKLAECDKREKLDLLKNKVKQFDGKYLKSGMVRLNRLISGKKVNKPL